VEPIKNGAIGTPTGAAEVGLVAAKWRMNARPSEFTSLHSLAAACAAADIRRANGERDTWLHSNGPRGLLALVRGLEDAESAGLEEEAEEEAARAGGGGRGGVEPQAAWTREMRTVPSALWGQTLTWVPGTHAQGCCGWALCRDCTSSCR